ncbi:helix-turn-helix domain-containing protein [Neisseria perflava]|uniref:helix-turn-helix domain-containing protein n=1 Tax=Neisseria perflava TaxID=33053 RepID=UPI00209C896F|nr:helix-turn-helix domain-containing protein [Neisseria perflava]MCP1660879.1 cytoskeleton protein RodZ [Neisseria perflava]MCP1773162.1 cytoskeleton protein RodZ [Neisseria perflava]
MQNQSKNTYNQEAAKALGEEFRQTREKLGIDVADVSKQLKLSVEQIQALESGDYSSFSGIVFVTGFLRSYARLFKMDEQEIEGRLNTVVPQTAGHTYAVNREKESSFNYQSIEKNGFPKWILGVAALALIIGGVYVWQNKSDFENQQQNAADSSAVQNSLQAPELQSSNIAVSKMKGDGTQIIAASEASAVAASAASEPAKPTVSVGPDELWIKVQYRSNLIIKDKDGKMVFSRIIPAGSERRFKGGAPYEVWVGIAAGAEANYAGTAINPAAHRAEGEKSATFTAGK